MKLRLPSVLIGGGIVLMIAAATYGFIAVGSVGTGDLNTTSLGEQITFQPAGSFRANVFTTRQPTTDRAPACTVRTAGGEVVDLDDARPYAVNTRYGMESSYGFDVSAGTTYLVRCGTRGEPGAFAVVEVPLRPQMVAIILGGGGALSVIGGIALLVVRRWRGTNTSADRSA